MSKNFLILVVKISIVSVSSFQLEKPRMKKNKQQVPLIVTFIMTIKINLKF